MKYDPGKHHRRSIRLREYDYSQSGGYFVTVCTYNRECIFGEIIDGEMKLNENGDLILEEWQRSSDIRKEIKLDAYVIMPNHFHAVVWIDMDVGANGRSPLL